MPLVDILAAKPATLASHVAALSAAAADKVAATRVALGAKQPAPAVQPPSIDPAYAMATAGRGAPSSLTSTADTPSEQDLNQQLETNLAALAGVNVMDEDGNFRAAPPPPP